ncbi:hypothetical protein Ocin01_19792 [Orchesella cincta]|uniref:Uncharacterized protein n=1 Tax=Orchesella cincta TaxID=48709 RepID=A0A1D2M1P7_ORCCI|nr:hypothetical protein Ocin01_19792 [Orchesella cincta]
MEFLGKFCFSKNKILVDMTKLDHSELGEPANGIRCGSEVVGKVFVSSSIGSSRLRSSISRRLESAFIRMMNRGTNMSYVAIDIETEEVAACRMVDLVQKGVVTDLNGIPPF